jgi:hypothetical protein
LPFFNTWSTIAPFAVGTLILLRSAGNDTMTLFVKADTKQNNRI